MKSTDCISLTDLNKKKIEIKLNQEWKKNQILNWNSCIRLFEVNEKKKKTKLKTTLTEFFETVVMLQEPFRSAKQLTHKEYGLSFLLHCALSCNLPFLCVCVWMYAIIVVSGCLCEYVSHTTIARRSVNHRALLHGWKINCIEHIAHVVLSLIHICIRISVSSFFFLQFWKK